MRILTAACHNDEWMMQGMLSLGAEGVLPGGYMESLLRVFEHLTQWVNHGQILNVPINLILIGSVGKL